jgi:hypothetical protein
VELKNPRACPRIWKCKNGKYLFWYHNHGGNTFQGRNPAWISGGIERNGKIIWGQPEILLYDAPNRRGMSYPDLIEQDGKYWITETNKENARAHAIPEEFLNKIWSQFDNSKVTRDGLVGEWNSDALKSKAVLHAPGKIESGFSKGFTIDMTIELGSLAPGQLILSSISKNGNSAVLKTGEYGSVEITLNDGLQTVKWNSDPGLVKGYGKHDIAVTVDHGPGIIQFVVDGAVCNGRDFRQYGWSPFKADLKDFRFDELVVGDLAVGEHLPKGKLVSLRIYERPLMNAELIGNHRLP